MKIDFKNINIHNINRYKMPASPKIAKNNKVQTGYLDVISTYNKAGLLFKGKIESAPREVEKLSKGEFDTYKAEVKRKISKLPVNNKIAAFFPINQNNIFIADRIVSNPCFYENFDFMHHVAFDLLKSVENIEQTKAKTILMDSLVKHKSLSEDKPQVTKLGKGIKYCKTTEDAKIKAEVINRIYSDDELSQNKNLTKNLPDILPNVQNSEELSNFNGFIDKVQSVRSDKKYTLYSILAILWNLQQSNTEIG